MVLFKKINVSDKQDKLTAGTNITIADNVISSTGGSGGGVSLDTAQTITGVKTFNANVKVDGEKYFYFGEKWIRDSGTALELVTTNTQPIAHYVNGIERFTIKNNEIDAKNTRITNVGAPTTDKDAATKKYVDDAIKAAIKP